MSTTRRGPRPVAERLRRLLVMLPWLMERGEAPVAEMAALFEVSEQELVRDLELASVCGLPPFVDEMIDVFIDEGVVFVGVPRLFTKAFRLTAPEGFSLLVAGRAALTLPGAAPDGPLGRAIDKLSVVLGDDGLVVDQPVPDTLGELTTAAETGERLRISHWSPARPDPTEREVTPRAVFSDRGAWYLMADDHASGQSRTFRVDRIGDVVHTGVHDELRPMAVPDSPQWFAESDLPVVVLRLAAADQWMLDQFPQEHVEYHDAHGTHGSAGPHGSPGSHGTSGDVDVVEVTLRVTNEAWLEALLLRLGDRAEVLRPAEWRDLRAEAAARLLAVYRDSP